MTAQDIFPAEVSLWLRRGAQLIDIREPAEYAGGHLPGAVNIPLAGLKPTPALSSAPVVLVCASGSRSAQAAALLLETGHSDVAHLLGGTIGWMREGRGVEFPEVDDGQH